MVGFILACKATVTEPSQVQILLSRPQFPERIVLFSFVYHFLELNEFSIFDALRNSLWRVDELATLIQDDLARSNFLQKSKL
jgi:hypothetical protein